MMWVYSPVPRVLSMPEDVGRLGRAAVKGSLSVGNVVTVLYYHLHIYTQLTALV